jgi:NodT family efflux transporter outer membrane factor (OMF) lipoprotein
MRRTALLAGSGAALALAGCAAVGPNYHRPEVPTPAAYQGAAALAQTARTRVTDQQQDLSRWWRGFDDPELQRLIQHALAANLDLAQAASRIREARYQVFLAGAPALPQVNADANASHEHISKNAFPPGFASLLGGGGTGGSSGSGGSSSSSSGVFSLPGSGVSLFQLGFDASWEIDLFGGTRRAVEAAKASVEAQEWSRHAAQASLAAEVASAYFALRADQRRTAVYQAEVARQQGLFTLIRDRRRAGVATSLDTERQTNQIAGAEARLPALQSDAEVQIHALGVLLGEAPEDLAAELTPAIAQPAPPPVIPAGLPSDLLSRRPDVRQAERQLAAASARIGVATAELYPSITITGSADLVSTALKTLLEWSSRQYSIAGAVKWPLLDGGKARADIGMAREEYAQALAAYQGAVLAALRDVEDALSRCAADQAQGQSLARALQSSRNAETIARQEYAVGLVDYSDVLNGQAAVLTAEDQIAQNDAALSRDTASLYKALGGGWDPAEAPVSAHG